MPEIIKIWNLRLKVILQIKLIFYENSGKTASLWPLFKTLFLRAFHINLQISKWSMGSATENAASKVLEYFSILDNLEKNIWGGVRTPPRYAHV